MQGVHVHVCVHMVRVCMMPARLVFWGCAPRGAARMPRARNEVLRSCPSCALAGVCLVQQGHMQGLETAGRAPAVDGSALAALEGGLKRWCALQCSRAV